MELEIYRTIGISDGARRRVAALIKFLKVVDAVAVRITRRSLIEIAEELKLPNIRQSIAIG